MKRVTECAAVLLLTGVRATLNFEAAPNFLLENLIDA